MKISEKYARHLISCKFPSESLVSFWIDRFEKLTQEEKEKWKIKLNK